MISRGGRAYSSPEIARPSSSDYHHVEGQDFTFEGIAANVKLLLKLIHEQSQASNGDQDGRRTQRVAGMISILDDVKSRIQKYSPPVGSPLKEFRRCNTDLRPHRAPRDKKSGADLVIDEKEKLRRELHASSAARKSLEAMCSSLGKEKEIMASELSRKVQELNGMEELINDLKAQNETLLAKVQACAAEHREKKHAGDQTQGVNAALQERNKALSEQLLKSLDGYRSLKRKYKDAKEESVGIQTTIEEMGVEVAAGLGRVHGLKQRLAATEVGEADIEREISALECMFESLNVTISKHMQKKSTCN
ncbi:myosin heavy chain, striated muscle [Herrania umbratica]|uniref:Myosin heavy chain, striated muscle n=1 Tax=Herrania umbratica TaxID=108875 RepID=A0A6J1AKT9_9ROSI|nr:myosin heavy chain, striated muscle [Herrania umbratica]